MIQSELIVGSHQRVQSPCCTREGGQQVQERGAVCAHYVLACEACGARVQAGRAALHQSSLRSSHRNLRVTSTLI